MTKLKTLAAAIAVSAVVAAPADACTRNGGGSAPKPRPPVTNGHRPCNKATPTPTPTPAPTPTPTPEPTPDPGPTAT
jgi:hypothetical protein